jgi:hypothetical protein
MWVLSLSFLGIKKMLESVWDGHSESEAKDHCQAWSILGNKME